MTTHTKVCFLLSWSGVRPPVSQLVSSFALMTLVPFSLSACGSRVRPNQAPNPTTEGRPETKKDPPDGGEHGTHTSFLDGVEFLPAAVWFRKVTLSLAGRLPSTEEKDLLLTESLPHERLIDPLMTEPPFFDLIKECFNDVLLTDKYFTVTEAQTLIDPEAYPNRSWFRKTGTRGVGKATIYGLVRGPLELIAYIVREERPFTEILTADYMMVNAMAAKSYGVEQNLHFEDPSDRNEFQPVRLPKPPKATYEGEFFPHAGVLTSAYYLHRYPTSIGNRNRHRAASFLKQFLDTDPLGFTNRPLDIAEENNVENPTMNAPGCVGCHAVLDPIAGAFQNMDVRARYRPPRGGWYTDMFAPGFRGEKIPDSESWRSLQWLGERAARDPRFVRSSVGHVWRCLMGREPLNPPDREVLSDYEAELRAYEEERSFLKKMGEEFVESNFNLKSVIKGILLSAFYRASNTQEEALPETRQSELSGLGSVHLLSPFALRRKIKAIFGSDWTLRRRGALTDSRYFPLLYGGIDSSQVVERLQDPNGVIGAIVQLMSNDLACKKSVEDFRRLPKERLLFPYVEIEDRPALQDMGDIEVLNRIRNNINHLYQRILGESPDGPNEADAERAYQLFVNIQAEGENGIKEERYHGFLPQYCQNGDLKKDAHYTIRAWNAVLSYLISDHRFVYH